MKQLMRSAQSLSRRRKIGVVLLVMLGGFFLLDDAPPTGAPEADLLPGQSGPAATVSSETSLDEDISRIEQRAAESEAAERMSDSFAGQVTPAPLVLPSSSDEQFAAVEPEPQEFPSLPRGLELPQRMESTVANTAPMSAAAPVVAPVPQPAVVAPPVATPAPSVRLTGRIEPLL